jgi:hypothetical protein
MAQKVTAALMPPKVRDDEFFATEVEAIRSVVNANADELDTVGKVASESAAKAAAYIGQAAGRTLWQLGSALRDKTLLRLCRITAGSLGQPAPLPSGSAIDATTGVLSYPGTDEVLLVLVDGALMVPLARTPEPGANVSTSIQRYGYANGRFDTFAADADGLQDSLSGPLGGATIRLNVRQLYLYDKLVFASTNGDASCKIFGFGAIISPGPPGTRFLNPFPGTILLDTVAFFCPDYGFLFDADNGSQANGRASAFHLYRNEFIKSAALNPTTPIVVQKGATLIVEDTIVGPEFRFSVDASSTIILRGSTNGAIGAGATDIWPVGTIDERVSAVGAGPAVVDLNDFTGAQMDEVIALIYTDGAADPAASPAWSRPGMWFEAFDPATGGYYHYYCGRGTYIPGNPTSGAGPCWHRIEKL